MSVSAAARVEWPQSLRTRQSQWLRQDQAAMHRSQLYAGLRRRQAAGRMNAGVVGVKGEDALHITFNSRQGEIKGKQSCHTVAADATTMAPPQPISPVCDGSSLDSGESNFWDWKSSPHGWRWSRGAQPQQGSIVFGTSEHDETMDSLVAHARARHQGDLARAPTGLLITEHCA